jgi:hypothetical protein
MAFFLGGLGVFLKWVIYSCSFWMNSRIPSSSSVWSRWCTLMYSPEGWILSYEKEVLTWWSCGMPEISEDSSESELT